MLGKISNSNCEPSEGEEFLMDFLSAERIKFDTQVKIENLKDDNKSYRLADVYLPNYGVYVEFFGRWNTSEADKERYREKRDVYNRNKIPCVYIYPENLGIVHFVFRRRLRKELEDHGKTRELFFYNSKLYFQDNGGEAFFLLFLSAFIIVYTILREPGDHYWETLIVSLVVLLFQVNRLIKGYKDYFIYKYSYVHFAQY